MKKLELSDRVKAIGMIAGALLMAAPLSAQSEQPAGQGQVVVTILAKHQGAPVPNISAHDLSVKVNGKQSNVMKWESLRGPENRVELVLLIDGSARSSLGTQLEDIVHFINGLPPNTKAAVAYMDEGRAVFTGPLSADHSRVLDALHLPGGLPGSSASPYFCLSDLATHWPSQDRAARRIVLMVTDGVDYYEMHYDPEDPYLQAAINDSVRAGLSVYSIYWLNQGFVDRTGYENNAGQNLLAALTEATGGISFWEGMGNPVSFKPYLDELTNRMENQYKLSFSTRLDGKPVVKYLKLKINVPSIKVTAPEQVYVDRAGAGE